MPLELRLEVSESRARIARALELIDAWHERLDPDDSEARRSLNELAEALDG